MSIDLPFEPTPEPTPMHDTDASLLSGGVVVMAATATDPAGHAQPVLVFRFTRPDGTGFWDPMILTMPPERMHDLKTLITQAVDAAVAAAEKGATP